MKSELDYAQAKKKKKAEKKKKKTPLNIFPYL